MKTLNKIIADKIDPTLIKPFKTKTPPKKLKQNNSLTIAIAEDIIDKVQIQEGDLGEELPMLS